MHRVEQGWKNARAGVPRAKAGVMRRVSMAVLKSTARHMLRGLEIIVPAAMHTHAMRRARSAAAREADHDEMRYDLRGAGHADCDGRGDGRAAGSGGGKEGIGASTRVDSLISTVTDNINNNNDSNSDSTRNRISNFFLSFFFFFFFVASMRIILIIGAQ